MKKIIFLTSLFLASCTHTDQKIKFNFDLENKSQNVGHGTGIDLVVIDERSNDIIGSKEFSPEEKIKISSSENLSEVLQKRILDNLLNKGFKKGFSNTLEIQIISLDYKAKREFFIGNSQANMEIKAIVINNRNQSTLTKDFSSSFSSKHFIAPLESTDEASINGMVKEIIENILNDREVLNKLAQ